MALSYKAEFIIPNVETFLSGANTHIIFYQLSNGSTSSVGTASQIIDYLFNNILVGQWGGAATITSQVSGANTIYTVDYSGLTSDPINDAGTRELTSVSIQSDGGNFYSAKFVSQDECIRLFPEMDTPNPEPGCQSCMETTVGECTNLTFDLDFNPSTEYIMVITDFFGVELRSSVTSTADGKVLFASDDFEPGVNAAGSLPLNIRFYDSENNLFTWSVGTTAYTCVNLKFNIGENDTIPDPFIGTASQV